MSDFPTLLDAAIARVQTNEMIDRKTAKGWLRNLRRASAFALDADASAFVGEVIKKSGPELLSQHRWCRFPYDPCWIEMNEEGYFREGFLPSDADDSVGFLVTGNWVSTFSRGFLKKGDGTIVGDKKTVEALPIFYQLGIDVPEEEIARSAERCQLSRVGYRLALAGAGGDKVSDELARDVCSRNRAVFHANFDLAKPEVLRRMILGSAGDLARIIAIGLLLTRPSSPIFHLQEVGRSSGIRKGKRRSFMAYRRCTIHLSREGSFNRVKEIYSGGRGPVRAHQVRGHWCQSQKESATPCSHDWEEIEERRKYQCRSCGRKRWWKKAHQRGDAGIGFVQKDYEVLR